VLVLKVIDLMICNLFNLIVVEGYVNYFMIIFLVYLINWELFGVWVVGVVCWFVLLGGVVVMWLLVIGYGLFCLLYLVSDFCFICFNW